MSLTAALCKHFIKSLGAVGGEKHKCCCSSQGSENPFTATTARSSLLTNIFAGNTAIVLGRTDKLYEFHSKVKIR